MWPAPETYCKSQTPAPSATTRNGFTGFKPRLDARVGLPADRIAVAKKSPSTTRLNQFHQTFSSRARPSRVHAAKARVAGESQSRKAILESCWRVNSKNDRIVIGNSSPLHVGCV